MTTILHGLTVPEQRAATTAGDRRALELLGEAQRLDAERMQLALERLEFPRHDRVCGACRDWLVFAYDPARGDAPCKVFTSARCRADAHGCGAFARR